MTARIVVHRGNRLEDLADALAGMLGKGGEPFRPDRVIVPGRAVGRWLSMRIAEKTGISMNREHLSLPAFIIRALEPHFSATGPFEQWSPESIALPIYLWLASELDGSRFPTLVPHRSGEPVARWFLAREIASALVKTYWHRPQRVADWVSGEDRSDWLGATWRSLAEARLVPPPLPSPDEIEKRFAAEPAPSEITPVFVFHPGRIPSRALEVLAVLGRERHAIHLFLLRPTWHYHGDQTSKATAARLGLPQDGAQDNQLIGALARVDRDLTDALVEIQERVGEPGFVDEDRYRPSDAPGLLGHIQNALLEARGTDALSRPVEGADASSLRIHSCHSPLREIEVLHNAILAFFGDFPDAHPSDILVLAPDLDRYAPLVDAVFSSPDQPDHAVPFSVADRPALFRSPVVDAFLSMLDLPQLRCSAPAVHDSLAHAAVREALDFTLDEVALFRTWIERSGIRWGIDADHRERTCGAAAGDATTWRGGLDRLMLGLALPAVPGRSFEEIIPCDPGASSDLAILGRFVAAAEALFAFCEAASEPRAAADWAGLLDPLVRALLATPAQRDVEGVGTLFDALKALGEIDGSPDASSTIPLEVLRRWFDLVLAGPPRRSGFLTGGVTFALLRPGRIIPRRMVALLGLDDGAIPRPERPAAFDPLASDPRQGDPSLKDDDRAAFLEALLSARERLHISFCGRSIADNSPVPPALPLSEFLEEIGERTGIDDPQQTVIQHPLHPFSPTYFDAGDPRLFSYSASDAQVARSIVAGPPPDAASAAPPRFPIPEEKHLSIDRLIRFFSAPLSTFANARLGIDLRDSDSLLESEEPMGLDGLVRYGARSETVRQFLDGAPPESVMRELRAGGSLPLGTPGEVAFEGIRKESDEILALLRGRLRPDDKRGPIPIPISIAVGGWILAGTIPPRHGEYLVDFRAGALRPKDLIHAWIYHLARSEVEPGDSLLALWPPPRLIGFNRRDASRATLEALVALYEEGICTPAPFHPAAGWAFVYRGNAKTDDAHDRARRALREAMDQEHDPETPFIERFFRGDLPLDETFVRFATTLFNPIATEAQGL
jgi:exodeoxyribonuclease V gamma subunit